MPSLPAVVTLSIDKGKTAHGLTGEIAPNRPLAALGQSSREIAVPRRVEHRPAVEPDEIGAIAASGNERKRAIFIVELDRGAIEGAAEFEIADQRCLLERALAGTNAGEFADC